MSRKPVGAFTLVEVLIVIVIMAILAAVVIPQFSESTDDAGRSTAQFNLSTLRSVIQTYKGQHAGALPTIDGTTGHLEELLQKTKADGTIDNVNGQYGPYLLEMPENPFTSQTKVKATTKTALNPPAKGDVTPNNGGGWLYNPNTGDIWLDSDPGYTF